MLVAIILFIIGALFGLHILTHILKNTPTPKLSVALHGLLVAIALVTIIVALINNGGNWRLTASVVLFIIAALGGFLMVYIDLGKKQMPPKALALLHPILAAIGLILLIIYTMGR
ncbi:MAG: hypothetical protein Q8933_14885 [Bacteroidota bacterium]|nr:hypothetical protein [Bacteroidota bacterium]MDP4190890.1 hypothetical protein [Bacteroidota bacterium]MDP4195294.1 hypothetical protein [Bacteroidota bacterium]